MSVPTVASAHRVVWRSSEGRIQLVPNTIDHDVAQRSCCSRRVMLETGIAGRCSLTNAAR